jgi:hypothetical protein
MSVNKIENKHQRKNHSQKSIHYTSTKINIGQNSCNDHIYGNNLTFCKKRFIKMISMDIIEKTSAAGLRVRDLSTATDVCC